jgi:hypothetical protein
MNRTARSSSWRDYVRRTYPLPRDRRRAALMLVLAVELLIVAVVLWDLITDAALLALDLAGLR